MTKYAVAIFIAIFAFSNTAKAVDADLNKPIEAQPVQVEQEQYVDEHGVTNAEELSMDYYVRNMDYDLNRGHDFVCALGYFSTKSGDHETALKIFRNCSGRGNSGTKIWMSYMYQNGYGVDKDPSKSTAWLKDAADDGYSIGQYNYGISLLKGYGIKRDIEAGREMVLKAAKQDDRHAKILIDSNYDVDIVTPDADQPDKQPLFQSCMKLAK